MGGVKAGETGIQGVPTGVLRDWWEAGGLRIRGPTFSSIKVRGILSNDRVNNCKSLLITNDETVSLSTLHSFVPQAEHSLP